MKSDENSVEIDLFDFAAVTILLLFTNSLVPRTIKSIWWLLKLKEKHTIWHHIDVKIIVIEKKFYICCSIDNHTHVDLALYESHLKLINIVISLLLLLLSSWNFSSILLTSILLIIIEINVINSIRINICISLEETFNPALYYAVSSLCNIPIWN